MKKYLSSILAVLIVATSFSACSKKENESEIDNSESTTIQTETETSHTSESSETTLQTESTFNEYINPLTGLTSSSQLVNSRPIAVTINNHLDSLPQYGISEADILFEMPVEGGITRLMGIYQNYETVPRVCSVRSCRYYFAEISQGFDAIYLHWGLDKSLAATTLANNNIDHFDGGVVGAPLFGRDPQRVGKYSLEHTAYLEGGNIKTVLDMYSKRIEVTDEFKNSTYFSFLDDGQTFNSEEVASNIRLSFSKAYYTNLQYDEASGKYLKSHCGKPHIDSDDGAQLAFKNVIILNTSITQPYVNTQLLNVDLTGGTGYYISDGKKVNISWTKGDVNSPIKLFNQDGTELSINKGNTYIGVIGYDKSVTIS